MNEEPVVAIHVAWEFDPDEDEGPTPSAYIKVPAAVMQEFENGGQAEDTVSEYLSDTYGWLVQGWHLRSDCTRRHDSRISRP